MREQGSDHISRYIMSAFGQSRATARIPRKKPGELSVVTTARIVLSVQYEGRFAFMPLNPVDIRADSAEWYGYIDGIPPQQSPSMLDVITQAHEFIYGDNFTEKSCRTLFDIDDKGIIHTILGYAGAYTCFVINGQYAYDSESEYSNIGFRGLTCRETPIYDLDVVEIFGFEKSCGKDLYTYFMAPGGEDWMRRVVVSPGEPISTVHEGFMFVFGGPYMHEDRIEHNMVDPIMGSQIAVVDPHTYRLTDIEGAVTDDSGLVTFSIDKPGEYYITAHGGRTKRRRAGLSLPWMPVVVK